MTDMRARGRMARGRRGSLAALAVGVTVGLAGTVLLSACGKSVGPGAGATAIATAGTTAIATAGTTAIATPGTTAGTSDFDKRAASVAETWRSSGAITAWGNGLVPLGDLTQVAGFDDRNDLKIAFGEGRIGVQGTLDDTKTSGVVTFPDGTTMPVALVGAHTAYIGLALPQGRPCATNERCTGLVITGATLGTTTLLTNRGAATVPAWRFAIAGLSQPIVRVAIDPAALTSPPAPTIDSPPISVGVGVAQLISVSGNEIRYQLWAGACDTDPRGFIHEEADIIVVGGTVTGPAANTACTANLVSMPVSVTSKVAVGDRPIVEAVSGQAVVVRYPVG